MTKKNAVAKVAPLTAEEQIKICENNLARFDKSPIELIPTPTRTFQVGESVRVGFLDNVVIQKVLFSGKAYVFSYTSSRDSAQSSTCYQANWWFNVKHLDNHADAPILMSQHRIFPAISSDISALLSLMESGGLVVDTRYQREYVWTEENKDALIESIFDHLDIGAFLLIRHHGYLHTDGTVKYRTLEGTEIEIQRKDDYTSAVIDGQQRLTTIFDFVLDRRPYKGVYFSQLNWRDRHEFMNKSVQYRLINEEQTTEKEVLRMFLQSNRGVPQQPEHLAEIQALYDAMK